MSTMLTIPVDYKNGNGSPTSWPGASGTKAKFSDGTRTHLSGNTSTDNGKTLGENINAGGSGNIYTSSDGFYSNVQTKTSTIFYSKHFIGHKNGNTISKGSSISSSTKSSWMEDVIGFHCEISTRPAGSGSEADGCGKVDQFRIAAVYADNSSKVRIMEMTQGGTAYSSQKYNSSPGTGWKALSYGLSQTDSTKVINEHWRLYGWIVEYTHKKTCGGGSKQKNCSGRIRYMRPLVSPTGSNSLGSSYTRSQLIYTIETTLSTAKSSSTAKILQLI